MIEITKEQRIKNIIAFLSILFGESKLWQEEIMNFPPDYLIEKFDRYIETTRDGSSWGIHPSLRKTVFERYCTKHGINPSQYHYVDG